MSKLRAQLNQIFNLIYSRFRYAPDIEVWNEREHWESYDQIPDEGEILGDCDCFAMACRKECRKIGIRSRLVYCRVNGGGHLVLECEGWILDNRQGEVVSNSSLEEYEWISMSGYERGEDWFTIA